jgi:hypothetical protein
MKQYYTLIQAFQPDGRNLQDYLEEQGIKYEVGADFAEDLLKQGHNQMSAWYGTLFKKFVVLIEEHELSAIKLCIDGIEVVPNRNGVKLQNRVRGYFSWILD